MIQKAGWVLLLLLSCHFLHAQEGKDENQWLQRDIPGKSKGQPITSSWHAGTAGILKSNGAELSLFSPSRIGMTKSTELLLRIGEEWLLPNIGIKHRWIGGERLIFSSEHTAYYTWPGLKILQSTGIKDLVPDSVTIRQGIAMRNELLLSWLMNPQVVGCPNPAPERILTLRAGMEFYVGNGKNEVPPFNYFHSLYHTQILNKKILYYGGLQFDSYFSHRFHYSLNALYYSIDFSRDFATEANGRLTYYVSQRIGLSLSCKAAYMKIKDNEVSSPGTNIRKSKFSCLPLLDFTYLIHPDRGEIRHGLFKNRRKMK